MSIVSRFTQFCHHAKGHTVNPELALREIIDVLDSLMKAIEEARYRGEIGAHSRLPDQV